MINNINVADVHQYRAGFMVTKMAESDHVVLDACDLLEHPYIDENGRENGIDARPFWHHIFVCAPKIQAQKYPDGKQKLLQIPESCIVEIMNIFRRSELPGNDVPEHLAKAAAEAVKRLQKLFELNVLEVIPDSSEGDFGDGALMSMATNANSRKQLLFIVQDNPLGRDLLATRHLESIRTKHQVFRFDKYGFLRQIPALKPKQEPESVPMAAAAPEPAQEPIPAPAPAREPKPAMPFFGGPMYRDRGKGSILDFKCIGPEPAEPNRSLGADGELKPGDELFFASGKPIKLDKQLGVGRESQVFAVEGCDDLCIKVITRPSLYKQERVNLLCSRSFEIDGCIFPDEPLFTKEGKFKAYVMKRIPDNGSVPLAALFNVRLRSRYLPEQADRRFYAKLSLALAQLVYKVHRRGIMLCDVSTGNVRIALDESGKAIPDRLYLIDLDSAQVGTKTAVYGGDGITPAYMAPEIQGKGWNGEQIPYSAELFSVSLLICQALLCGAFPFTAIDVAADEPFDELTAIREGKFPYGSSGERRSSGTSAPGIRAFIWSNMTSKLKDAIRKNMTAEPKDRVNLYDLLLLLVEYNKWIDREETFKLYPMIRSLMPTAYKPYWHQCRKCGEMFDVANAEGGAFGNGIFMCPKCAASPVAVCAGEGCNKTTLTRGEELQGRKAKRFCPECYEKQKAAEDIRLSHYKSCSCGRSFPVSIAEARSGSEPDKCPECIRAAAQPGYKPKHAAEPASAPPPKDLDSSSTKNNRFPRLDNLWRWKAG